MRLRNEGTFPRGTIADRILARALQKLINVSVVLPAFASPVADFFVDLNPGKAS
jgi:hypothetical protein